MKRAGLILLILTVFTCEVHADYNEGWETGKDLANQIGKDTSDPNSMMDKLGKPLFDKQEKMTPLNGQDPIYECSGANAYNGKTFTSSAECNTKCSPGTCRSGFTAQIQDPSTHYFLDIRASVGASGSMTFTARQDLDMNGTVDATYTPSRRVSVICSSGYLSCPAGPFSAPTCTAFRWTSTNGRLREVPVTTNAQADALGSCHCITTYCGYSMAGDGRKNALEDLGTSLSVAVITQGDTRFSISKVLSDPAAMRIAFNGQKASYGGATPFSYTGGHPNPEVFIGNGTALSNAGQAEMVNQLSDPNSLGYMLNNSPAYQTSSLSAYSCQIKKTVSVHTTHTPNYCWTWEYRYRWDHAVWCDGQWISAIVSDRDGCAMPGFFEDPNCTYTQINKWGVTTGDMCPGNAAPGTSVQAGWWVGAFHNWPGKHTDAWHCYERNYHEFLVSSDDGPAINNISSCSPDASCTLKDEQVCDLNGNNCVYTIRNGTSTSITPPSTCTTINSELASYKVCSMGTYFTLTRQSDGAVFTVSDGAQDFFTIKRSYTCTADSSGIDLTDAKRQSKAIYDSAALTDDGTLSYSATNRTYDPATKTFGAITNDTNTKSIGADTLKDGELGQVCRVQVQSQKTDINQGRADSDILVTTSMTQTEARLCSKNDSGIWVCPYDAGKGEVIKTDCSADSMFNEGMATLNAMEEARKSAVCAKP